MKIVFVLLFLLNFLWSSTSNVQVPSSILSAEEKAWLNQHPTLTLASSDDNPHLAFRDEHGNVQGFDAALIAQINQNLGTHFSLKLYHGWDKTYHATLNNEVHGILAITNTPSRTELFHFSPPYHYEPSYVVTQKHQKEIETLSALNGKKVATEQSSIINEILMKEAPKATRVHGENVYEILKMVQEGKADCAFIEGMSNQELKAMHLKIAGSFYTESGEYTIGIRKPNPILASIITKGVHSISKEQMQTLKDKWFKQASLFTIEELNYIKHAPVLKIGIEDWPPMISTKDGVNIEGITGELLTRVIQISGLKTKLISAGWSDLLHDFKAGKIDILPATYFTEERATYGLFSDPYTQINNTIYVNKNNQSIKSFEDLKGKTLAIQKGFGTIDPIRKKFPEITIIETPTLEDAILKVSNEEVDAFFEAQIVAQNFLQKLLITNIKPIFQNSIEAGNLHLFLAKENHILQSILNKALNIIPQYEKNNIINKWLNQEFKKNINIAFTKSREPYTIDHALAKGIEYDIAKSVFSKSNVTFSSEKFLFRDAMAKALHEDTKLDVSVGIKPKEDAFFYSDALLSLENVVITRDDVDFAIENINDLKDKHVIAFEGAFQHLGEAYATLFSPQNRPLTYHETPRQDEQVLALFNHKADAIIIDRNILEWYLKKLYGATPPHYRAYNLFPKLNHYHVAFREKNLRDLFNQNLRHLKASGEYTKIFSDYLTTNIESKTKISTLFASLVAKGIFTEDMRKLQDITTVFSKLPYLQKIEIFNNESELLLSHTKTESTHFMHHDSFHSLSHIPQKVGYIHLYFDETMLEQYLQDHTAIPHINRFAALNHYAEIKEIYKRLDFLDRLSFTQKEEAFIQKHPRVTFSALKSYPLYWHENDKEDGVYTDFLKIIEQKSGLTFEHHPLASGSDAHNAFPNTQIDLLGDVKTPLVLESSKLFSDELLAFRFIIVTNHEGRFTKDIANMQGRIVIPKEYAASTIIKMHYPNLAFIEVETIEEALMLIDQQKADISIVHEAEGTHLLQVSYPNLKIVGMTNETVSHVFAMSSIHPELLSIINKVLASLDYEQKQAIKDKWFKTKITTEVDYSIIYEIVAVLGLIILLFLAYNQRLKYLVKEKTQELEKLLSSFDKNVLAIKLNEEGKIIYVSEALCKISEYTQEELLGNGTALLSTKTNKRILKDFKKALNDKKPWNGKIINTSKSGKTYWTKTKLFQEYKENGTFLNHTVILQDITTQKEVELLYQEIEDTQKEIIFKMGAIGEARSQETGQHVKRVAEYSKLLALHYGLSHKEAEIIKLASPMHDIGKVAIADSILNKPAKLTPEEFNMIQTHAELGYEMLKNSRRTLLKTAAIIAYEHHEKFDGTGYPRGLKGEEIHIYGRITALADVYDALGNERVYKKAWDDESIDAFFKEEKGKHFDPKLVDIFFKQRDKFIEIKNSYKDTTSP